MNFTGISMVIVLAAVSGVVARMLKQPLLVGYLFAGVIAVLTGVVSDANQLEGLAQIGVALLLFLVGLEMNVQELPQLGKASFITGVGQIFFTFGLGWVLATLLGFSPIAAVYIGVALTFSSTIIVIKLLSERTDLNTLYGKISLGVLLVQDFIAVLILMLLAGLGQGEGLSVMQFGLILAKAILLFLATLAISKNIIPFVFEHFFSQNIELLFVTSLAWALGFATMVGGPLGLSLEIGGFLAGLALSGLHENLQIASRLRPIRDFFLTIFFIFLGTQLTVGNISAVIVPAIIFSIFVLMGKPIIVALIIELLGFRKKTALFAGLALAQISEFSLIIMAEGSAIGHLGAQEVATIILVAIITMTGSTYFISGADTIFNYLKGFLSIMERRSKNRSALVKSNIGLKNHIVLVGADRTGGSLISLLQKKSGKNLIVVDFNPAIISRLSRNKVNAIFGDITDPEIIEAVNLPGALLVISTIARNVDNAFLLSEIKNKKSSARTVFIAKTIREAKEYYGKGADYVILPETTAGEHIRHLIKSHGFSSNHFHKLGVSHSKRLGKL